MPWKTGRDFASKHNKKLKGAAATKAAKVATAMVNRGVDEGIAIATANRVGNNYQGSGRKSGTAKSRTGKTRSWTGK